MALKADAVWTPAKESTNRKGALNNSRKLTRFRSRHNRSRWPNRSPFSGSVSLRSSKRISKVASDRICNFIYASIVTADT